MKIISIIALAVIISAAIGSTMFILNVGIRGFVNVPSRTFDINLVIDRESGVTLYDLGRVEIPDGGVIVKVILVEKEGNFTVAVSGVLTLKSQTRTYTIDMPCAIVVGVPCYRIMMIIPGWDEPMPIEGGVYDVNLKLVWSEASGTGRFHAKLQLMYMQCSTNS